MTDGVSAINGNAQGVEPIKSKKLVEYAGNVANQPLGWSNGFNTNQLGGLLNGSMTASTAYQG